MTAAIAVDITRELQIVLATHPDVTDVRTHGNATLVQSSTKTVLVAHAAGTFSIEAPDQGLRATAGSLFDVIDYVGAYLRA